VKVLNQNTKVEKVRTNWQRVMRPLLIIIVVLAFYGFCAGNVWAQATNIYITPDGGGTSVCTSNTHPPSWFNNSANWGSNSSQIGPGTIVHLCGTFSGGLNSNMLSAQASGSNGNPVRILFESGAKLTSPAWSGTAGAIDISDHSYIVVDGGTEGVIQNTANGTLLANHQASSVGVYLNHCTPGCEVKNLTISNIYVHTSVSDSSIDQTNTNAVKFVQTDGVTIDNNVFHDCGWCINGWGNNVNIFGNEVYNCDHGIAFGASGNATNINIHDNHIHDFTNWDTSCDCYHHDGLHMWNANPTQTTAANIYNNLFDGDSGVNITSFFFTENHHTGMHVFNNIFVLKPGRTMGGLIWFTNSDSVQTPFILNNTFIGNGANPSSCIKMQGVTGVTIKNNLTSGCNTLVDLEDGTSVAASDNDIYEAKSPGGSSTWQLNGAGTDTFSAWQAETGGDTHSSYHSTASLNADGTLKSGSPAIAAGVNLTNLGITALDSDKSGVLRPSTGPWDVGAHSSGTVAVKPLPPSNVTAIVQ
jgi:hypothetical protein